jgi:hypothetical protein
MTVERTQEIEFIRSEIIGPSVEVIDCDGLDKVSFNSQKSFVYPEQLLGKGIPVFWRVDEKMPWQEIIHYRNETPLNSYGAGVLFPGGVRQAEFENSTSVSSSNNADPEDAIDIEDEISGIAINDQKGNSDDDRVPVSRDDEVINDALSEDFDVTSPDIFRPSTLGLTFCLADSDGELIVSVPSFKKFKWQTEEDTPFQVNGCYEKCDKTINADGESKNYPAWRRRPVTNENSVIKLSINSLILGKVQKHQVPLIEGSHLLLSIQTYCRKINDQWVVTVILRNNTSGESLTNNALKIAHTLFQSHLEVSLRGNSFSHYPEGVRPFDKLDIDEQSLALLYRDASTWGIGHGCSAGWDSGLGETPDCIFADLLPAVELPSMTPDITMDGKSVSLSMRELANLPNYDCDNVAWQSLENLLSLYRNWIDDQTINIPKMDSRFSNIADCHMDACNQCHDRMKSGIEILKENSNARLAFKLANKSMLLQQIASKVLKKRPLEWDGNLVAPANPVGNLSRSPAEIYDEKAYSGLGSWRAFQIAFLLMSLEGIVHDTKSNDRDIVDLIWFPTGGGKTEAYLGLAAFYIFHQRLLMNLSAGNDSLRRDGTNVFMRYTLRMLTTQQFQRAASLICSMEDIRENDKDLNLGETRFSLGLWIGGDGSPNSCTVAKTAINHFKKGDVEGNPLVLTECPWCRSEIGRLARRPAKINTRIWPDLSLAGIGTDGRNEPVLKCSDESCHFGGEYGTLPIEVIDERIYRNPPSIFISTADKFAMLAYKPEAGSLFGKKHGRSGIVVQERQPPGLIIQDEFHLISGPLGTMYGVYEGVIEKLCSIEMKNGQVIKPKIVASTATIRGAAEQVKSVYARDDLQLFPSPGLLMKDSFFGRYAEVESSNALASGRLYLGIHAHGYGSFLTAQVRVFTAVLFRAWFFDNDKKDAWWTLLAFYNSLRELGGARTLFTSDISSRLKNYSRRYGCKDKQRYLNAVEELTSRKSQAELVGMMDRLSLEWNQRRSLDVCLASNIIEVGVDIERLSLMAVVGQPKSTAQYIQVTGRVGRKWWKRPGLILSMYNPAKSRDRSHFEQFESYHRRLYERVEPTSATPFSVEAMDRVMVGALLVWARQFYDASTPGESLSEYREHLETGFEILKERCKLIVQEPQEQKRVLNTMTKVYKRLLDKWAKNPQMWQDYPQEIDGEYLMLWPGQFSTEAQRSKGEIVPSSMRNVDASAYLQITSYYITSEN